MCKTVSIFSKRTVKASAKCLTLVAATAAMCAQMGLDGMDAEAAKCALRDIAQERGTAKAKAIILDMTTSCDDPFDPIGGGFCA